MKKRALHIASTLVLGISLLLMNGCKAEINNKEYLQKVLNNLGQIKSASYYTKSEGWASGDTSPYCTYHRFVKEYVNPADTFVGVSFIKFLQEDTTIMDFCYDGKMRTLLYSDEKRMVIDSFNINPNPIRTINTPFFNYAKTLIDYALKTNDRIAIESKDFRDSIQFSFSISDTVVEIIGNRIAYTPSLYGSHKGDVSKYDMWINKKDNLPYRIKRDMPHDISIETCSNYKLNGIRIEDFKASEYFPKDVIIQQYTRTRSNAISDFVGKAAPDWVLKDANNNTAALKTLKSKVLMIQFTSVSCGACQASIPFLKKLSSDYDIKDFDFVAIESFTRNPEVLKRYQGRNHFSYKFLMSTNEVTKRYRIKSIPVFFILDKNRVIRKVIQGYGIGTTDKEIRDAINELI